MAMSIPVDENGCSDLQALVERAGRRDHAPAGHVVKLPHELQSLADKWQIRRQPRAWLFTCLACGDEYECTCFPSGNLTPRQLKHLKYHRHSRS